MVARRRTPAAGGQRRGWLVAVAALAILAVVFATLWLIFSVFAGDEETLVGPDGEATVSNIVQDPEEYYGEIITVDAEVVEVLSPFAYVVTGEPLTGGGTEELLVIGPPPQIVADDPEAEALQDTYAPGDFIQVTGEVREFDRAALEQELQAELDDEQFADFEGQPVLVSQGEGLTSSLVGPQGVIASPEDILENPDEYLDELVSVNEPISEVIGPDAFTLGDGLLVISAVEEVTGDALTEGALASASGVVQEFDQATMEAEYDIQLEDEQMEQFAGQPVLIADVLRITPQPAQ